MCVGAVKAQCHDYMECNPWRTPLIDDAQVITARRRQRLSTAFLVLLALRAAWSFAIAAFFSGARTSSPFPLLLGFSTRATYSVGRRLSAMDLLRATVVLVPLPALYSLAQITSTSLLRGPELVASMPPCHRFQDHRMGDAPRARAPRFPGADHADSRPTVLPVRRAPVRRRAFAGGVPAARPGDQPPLLRPRTRLYQPRVAREP
jgi:hypothetical protein